MCVQLVDLPVGTDLITTADILQRVAVEMAASGKGISPINFLDIIPRSAHVLTGSEAGTLIGRPPAPGAMCGAEMRDILCDGRAFSMEAATVVLGRAASDRGALMFGLLGVPCAGCMCAHECRSCMRDTACAQEAMLLCELQSDAGLYRNSMDASTVR